MSGEEFNVEFDYGPIDFWYNEHVFFYYSLDLGVTWTFIDTIFIDSIEVTINPIVNYNWQVPIIESSECIIIISRFEGMCWDESDNVFAISSLSSMEDLNMLESNDLRIYPNPVKSGCEIQIDSKELKELNAKLINIKGQEIGSYYLIDGDMRIPTSNIKAGQYFVIVEYKGKLLIKKVLIN